MQCLWSFKDSTNKWDQSKENKNASPLNKINMYNNYSDHLQAMEK